MKKEEKRKRQRGRNGCTETDANLSYVIYRSKVGCTVHRTYFRDSRVEARWPIFVFTGLSARTRAFLRSRETMLGLPRLRYPKITKKKKKKWNLQPVHADSIPIRLIWRRTRQGDFTKLSCLSHTRVTDFFFKKNANGSIRWRKPERRRRSNP